MQAVLVESGSYGWETDLVSVGGISLGNTIDWNDHINMHSRVKEYKRYRWSRFDSLPLSLLSFTLHITALSEHDYHFLRYCLHRQGQVMEPEYLKSEVCIANNSFTHGEHSQNVVGKHFFTKGSNSTRCFWNTLKSRRPLKKSVLSRPLK